MNHLQDLIHEGYARLKVDNAKTSTDSPLPTKEEVDGGKNSEFVTIIPTANFSTPS